MDSRSPSHFSTGQARPRRPRKKSVPDVASKHSDMNTSHGWGASTSTSIGQNAAGYSKAGYWPSAFERGDDFIAFESSSLGSSPPTPPHPVADLAQVADKGQQPVRSHPPLHLGQKRRWESDSLDQNGGYASKKSMVDATLRKAPWAAEVAWERCNNAAEMYSFHSYTDTADTETMSRLHEEVKAFVEYISPTPVEHEVRSHIVQLISNTIRMSFQDAVVLPFGSFETKLYLPLGYVSAQPMSTRIEIQVKHISDIDLVVQSEMMTEYDKDQVLRYLAGVLRRAGITERVTVIAKAKVPIVKFVTTHGTYILLLVFRRGLKTLLFRPVCRRYKYQPNEWCGCGENG